MHDDILTFSALRKTLEDYLSPEQVATLVQAFETAKAAHAGQQRRSGEPYITHPIAVAHILADMRLDHESIAAALLHDVVEDTDLSAEDIEKRFGPDIADLVEGVTKLTKMNFGSYAEAQAENFRKMFLAMVQDIRVIIIKLADRLHNMRTLGALSPEKRSRIAVETLEIYAPIALRLGMHAFQLELETLGFAMLYPMRYRVLKEAVQKAGGNRKTVLDKIENTLKERFQEVDLPILMIKGREKHLYSIYKKMKTKGVAFSEIMDVYGIRIVVPTVDDCYRTLGIAHNLYKPVPEHFKDYIAIPKVNGYQSLHTVLFGPYGIPIELQIRTEDMDTLANQGIAAHWLYKAKQTDEHSAYTRVRQWLKKLMEMQISAGDSIEFIENVKIDLFPDEVYVFAPDGKIMELPSGATPIDFAYAVHTDIGNTCVAAKVNRRFVPLSTPLVNGQKAEIITAGNARPNPAWLDFVVTGKARSSIRHYLKSQRHEEARALGKNLLEKALAGISLTLEKMSDTQVKAVLQESNLDSLNDLFDEIGLGNRMAMLEAQRLATPSSAHPPPDEASTTPLSTEDTIPLTIKGTEGMVLHFSECCYPIPGDSIVGYLRKGQGLEVHTNQCREANELRKQPERILHLRWGENIEGDFQTKIFLEVHNRAGMLALLGQAIFKANANIKHIDMLEHDDDYACVNLVLTVKNRVHLAQIIREVRKIREAHRIHRIR